MLTYQDFEQSQNKAQFIINAINQYKGSTYYIKASDSYRYFYGQNNILKRMKWFYNSAGIKQEDKFVTNNRIAAEFYKKIILQENSYLLANGLTTNEEIKTELGKDKFDYVLQQVGLNTLLGGICFIYPYIQEGRFKINYFTALESFGLFDEYTAEIKALIRWWQLADDKPLNIEFYTETEKINYVTNQTGGAVTEISRQPYITRNVVDVTGVRETSSSGWGQIPVIACYAPTRKPYLNEALKTKIDLYDIVLSDFGNNLEDAQDIYWILKNYQGQDIGEFLADFKLYKAIKVDGDGAAEAKTLEVPYQARKEALDIIKKQIYEDAMALDMSTVSGGSLTNVAIKACMIDLDLKTDLFEWSIISAVEKIIGFLKIFKTNLTDDFEIRFIRRNIVNDTEIIDNIMKCRSDLSLRTALELNPYIEDPDKVIEEIELEDLPPLRKREE